MALEERLVDRHRLDGDDALVDLEALDPVDEQHWIAMRQRRHHPPDVERASGRAGGGGAGRFVVHSRLAALRLLLRGGAGAAGAVAETDGSAAFSAARTSLVTSRLAARRERRALLEKHVGAAALHHLLIDRRRAWSRSADRRKPGCARSAAARAGAPANPAAPWPGRRGSSPRSAASGALPSGSASTAAWIVLRSAASGVPSACWRLRRAVIWPCRAVFAALQAVHSLLTFWRSTMAMTAPGTAWAKAAAGVSVAAVAAAMMAILRIRIESLR